MAAMKRKTTRKKRVNKPKVCRFCEDRILYLDYKDIDILTRYVTEKGRIIPRRITGTCGFHQTMLAKAIKRGRSLAMVP